MASIETAKSSLEDMREQLQIAYHWHQAICQEIACKNAELNRWHGKIVELEAAIHRREREELFLQTDEEFKGANKCD